MTDFPRTIIARPQHPISRTLLSPNALRVLYRLKDHGFIAYLVGGCVRDLWLGREPKDFDIVTDATPGQIKRLFRNCRLIGRRFRLAHLHFSDEIIEVATFRAPEAGEERDEPGPDSGRRPQHLKDEDGMVLRDNVFGTPEEDARRRDFTVNALCYNIADFSLIDHVGGGADLERGIIRTIGDPTVRFTEDPVRMLRAVRFAALLGFTIEAETWQALVSLSSTISRAAPPRLYEEILKLFLAGEGEKSYQLLRQTGLFGTLFPHFSDWLATESDGFPHTRVGQGLERIDVAYLRGEKTSPQLFLAILFGEYLEEKGRAFRAAGMPEQQSVDAAMAELMAEVAPVVLIPHKTGILVRDIIASRGRFRKTLGKNPRTFANRPGFPDAFAYFRFTSDICGENGDLVSWWDAFVAGEAPLPVVTGPDPDRHGALQEPKKRSRRRRRKRRTGKNGGKDGRSGNDSGVTE
jgi:poly(A) polymerase